MNDAQREQIALFRFSIISPVLTGQEPNAADYFRRISARQHEVPVYGLKEYSPKTMYDWLLAYRKHGFEGLKPLRRSDKAKSRKITPEMEKMILAEREKHPERSGQLFYEQLCAQGKLLPSELSYSTLYRYLKRNDLLTQHQRKEGDRKRFGYDAINILWQGDTMHGPYIRTRGKKTKTYLVALIDDCSRIIPYAAFMTKENATGIARIVKEAIARRGLPKMLYFDNGKPYRNDILRYACAQLGIHLIHTEPYTPQAKGKIERFFRTVRDRFLPLVNGEGTKPDERFKDIDALNSAYHRWLETDYHRKIHSAIGMTPLDKYMSQISTVKHVEAPGTMDRLFLKRETRKVKHDATISFDRRLYEVAPILIGKTVEIRYDPEERQTLYIYDAGQAIGTASECVMRDNARMKRKKKSSTLLSKTHEKTANKRAGKGIQETGETNSQTSQNTRNTKKALPFKAIIADGEKDV